MKVSVFGLGYVGVVASACLSRDGFTVVGVDIYEEKVRLVNSGQATIIELGLGELLEAGVKSGRLSATTSADEAVARTDISLICVGTPSRPDGSQDLLAVYRVCEQIGDAIARKGRSHIVVIRSTVLPGTTAKCAEILREHAGDVPVHLAMNPEFLREGSAIRDYDAPPFTVIGTDDPVAEAALREMYAAIIAPVFVTEPAIAEILKLASNAWHATKITYANEIGRLAKASGVDGREVLRILMEDTKLNVSKAYLRPGFAFGGSCLPKDVRALTYFAKTESIDVPLLDALQLSNHAQIELALRQVIATGKRRVGLLGLSFKPGTDDLRESPTVELAERLIGKGYELRIFDAAVHEAKLVGANRAYIEQKIPHLSRLLVESLDEIADHAEVIIISYGAAEFRSLLASIDPGIQIIDLAGTFPPSFFEGKPYDGIAW
jgi:GDP-mannose 6-dehydrogenase